VNYASPACVRLFGREMEDLIGLDAEGLGRLLGPRCEPRAWKKLAVWLQDQLAPATAAVPDSRLIELDAPRLSLETRARRNESESVPVILYFHDVTERMEIDRIKSEFLSTAAHELRTPMASIFGYAELLLQREGYDEATRREMLEIILNQAKLSSALVNELLDLARIEARRGKDFNFEPLDLADLVREAVLADPEGLQWKWPARVTLPEAPVRVLADANKLRQALGNVLSNAYKYSPAGGEVAIGLLEAPGEVGLAISDQGLGMTPEQTARVCERFYRSDPAGPIPGTGLGMSIVQEIVALHRGRLDIRSAPRAGTTVTLWLPAGGATPLAS
jgi:signal transduction histidine kinase